MFHIIITAYQNNELKVVNVGTKKKNLCQVVRSGFRQAQAVRDRNIYHVVPSLFVGYMAGWI